MNRSKVKGSAYETKISRLLSKELKIEVKKVPLSGSVEGWKGDLISFHPSFPYSVECKHWKYIDWNNLLTAKTSTILEFWRQATRQANEMNLRPLVVFRWDRSKDFVCWNVPNYATINKIEINAHGERFYVALLSDWIKERKNGKEV